MRCEVCLSGVQFALPVPFFFPAAWSANEIGSPIGYEGARGSKIKTERARRLSLSLELPQQNTIYWAA